MKPICHDDIVSCANLSPDMIDTTSTYSTFIYQQCNMLFLRTIYNYFIICTCNDMIQ